MAEIISALSNGSQVKVVYSYTQNIAANTSTLTAELYVHRDSAATSTDSSCSAYININGARAMTYTAGFTIGSSWVKIGSTCTATVAHNADGTKSCPIVGYFSSSISTKLTNLSVSQSVTLTTIPRKSQITAIMNDFNIGDGFLVYTNRKSTSFTHALNLYFGSYSTTCAYDITDDYFFDSSTYADSLYQQIKTTNLGTGMLRLITYASDNSVIGYTEMAFTAHVVNSDPTIAGFSCTDGDPSTFTLTGNPAQIVQLKSIVQVVIDGATAYNHATISSYKVQYGSRTMTSTSYVINFGTLSENDNLTVTVTDSRGNSVQRSVYITTIPYAAPAVGSATLSRVNNIEAGSVLTCAGAFAHLMVTTAHYSLKYRFKATSTGTWGDYIAISPTMTGDNFTFNANIGNYSINSSYNFEVVASDYYASTVLPLLLPTAKPVLSIRNGMVGVNKIPEAGGLDVSGDIYTNSSKVYSDGYHPACDNATNSTNATNADKVDGIHLMKGSTSGTIATQSSYGSVYYSADINVSFGTTLPGVPVITTGLITNGIGFLKIKSVSTTGFICNLVNAVTSTGANYTIYWIAAY